MVFEDNFIPTGQTGQTIVDTKLKIWVNVARLNQDSVAYQIDIEYDPLLEPDRLWVPRDETDVLLGKPQGPFAGLRRFRSEKFQKIDSFSCTFPLGWKDDFNLKFDQSLEQFASTIGILKYDRVPIIENNTYEFFRQLCL